MPRPVRASMILMADPAGALEDVDPADQGDDARHGIQPLLVGTPQPGLLPEQDRERRDLPDELDPDRQRDQRADDRRRVKNVAIAVTAPITSSEMWGNRSVWCSLPNGRKNMPIYRAALNGSREAPSRPV